MKNILPRGKILIIHAVARILSLKRSNIKEDPKVSRGLNLE